MEVCGYFILCVRIADNVHKADNVHIADNVHKFLIKLKVISFINKSANQRPSGTCIKYLAKLTPCKKVAKFAIFRASERISSAGWASIRQNS